MSVTMRIIQQYDIRNEQAFLDLERKFAALEAARPDYPKGRRMKPLAGSMPTNTLNASFRTSTPRTRPFPFLLATPPMKPSSSGNCRSSSPHGSNSTKTWSIRHDIT